MDKEDREKLHKDYRKSVAKGRFGQALKQNRLLYNEIFENYMEALNGTKKVFIDGLGGLEVEATWILSQIQLNNLEES